MTTHAEFAAQLLASAQAARRYGAPMIAEVAAAQGALESRYGESALAVKGRNLFGIKAGKRWAGATVDLPGWEHIAGRDVPMMIRWASFPSWTACFAYYGELIRTLPWFEDAEQAAKRGDAMAYLDGLMPLPASLSAYHQPEPGWATAPDYRRAVVGVMFSYPELCRVFPEDPRQAWGQPGA